LIIDFFNMTFEDWEAKVRGFDLLDIFVNQTMNPFEMAINFYIELGDPFYKSGATFSYSSPDDDMFAGIFMVDDGSLDIYEVFWRWLVDPAKWILEVMFWRILNGVQGSLPDWIVNHCFWDWLGISFPDDFLFT